MPRWIVWSKVGFVSKTLGIMFCFSNNCCSVLSPQVVQRYLKGIRRMHLDLTRYGRYILEIITYHYYCYPHYRWSCYTKLFKQWISHWLIIFLWTLKLLLYFIYCTIVEIIRISGSSINCRTCSSPSPS